ncbi:TPA: hypothetical protein EYP70_03385 [Candidatus Bathyarchaeota archaeon]|nr:hypothetical protein [Candidatus Bathyarchaeota archaeon]
MRGLKTFDVKVDAGSHDRFFCPIYVELKNLANTGFRQAFVRDLEINKTFPAQIYSAENGIVRVYWIIDELRKGSGKRYEISLSESRTELSDLPIVKLEDESGKVSVYIGENLFTSYHYGKEVIRPFLFPVVGPKGHSVTRNYPMIPDVPGETKDHLHHRSLWAAHGDINGVDDWSESPDCGRIVHRRFEVLVSGPVFGELVALNDWVSKEGVKVIEERRRIRVYNTPDYSRLIDLDVKFTATEGDVKFGDTKEGGIISVRVASSMDVVRGGRIENSYGAVNEEESWGRRAQWCDYSGPVKNVWVGIAIFDFPSNLRHPTYWHARNYGLMTANPFGISYFTGGPRGIGDYKLKEGDTLEFKYRIFIHEGDAEKGGVREAYHNYINPPKVIIES